MIAIVLAWLAGATAFPPRALLAFPTGETLHSGKQGVTCAACHSGGASPAVQFIGPAAVEIGERATYRFEVQSMAANQIAAGFNVAASGGLLGTLPDQDEQLIPVPGSTAELTHTQPKMNADMVAEWDFTWTAPTTPGTYTLFGAGNSVNLNGLDTGDRSNTASFEIVVSEATAPTPTATPIPTETPPGVRTGPSGHCVGDCNGDGTVTVDELITGVNIALGNQSIDACPALDANGDGIAEINELIAAVAAALTGCA
jgi:hypothetical protein